MRHSLRAGIGALTLSLVSTVGLSACGSDDSHHDDAYVGVCTDQQGNRIDDRYCDTDHHDDNSANTFFWLWMLSNSTNRLPAVGSHVNGGTRYLPSGSNYYVGAPRKGGSFSTKTMHRPKVTSNIARTPANSTSRLSTSTPSTKATSTASPSSKTTSTRTSAPSTKTTSTPSPTTTRKSYTYGGGSGSKSKRR